VTDRRSSALDTRSDTDALISTPGWRDRFGDPLRNRPRSQRTSRPVKAHLSEQRSLRSKNRLSKATLYATLSALKRFFLWLAGQPGYKSRISYSDAEYFNLSAKDTRIAKAHREARVPTLDQIRHIIRTMPATTEISYQSYHSI